MDTTYRNDLRELNEVNYARFEARLDQRLAESDVRWERRLAELRGFFETWLAEMDTRWERRLGEYRSEVRDVKADLIKWMFLFVAGGTLTILGVLITIVRS